MKFSLHFFLFLIFGCGLSTAQINFHPKIITQFTNSSSDNLEQKFLADVDTDGDLDLVGRINNGVVWYENLDGAGNFGNPQVIYTTSEQNSPGYLYFMDDVISVRDFDNNGAVDVLFGSRDANIPNYFTLFVKFNDGNGNFSERFGLGSDIGGVSPLKITDFDGDGDLDMFVYYSYYFSFGYREYVGSETGTDSGFNWFGLPSFTSFIRVLCLDVDGDGDQDLVQYPNTAELYLHENINGFTDLEAPQYFVTLDDEYRLNSYSQSDLDGDGDLDLITYVRDSNNLYDLIWYENIDGNISFEIQHSILSNESFEIEYSSNDFDNDGDLDIIVSNLDDDIVFWQENLDSQGNFGEPQTLLSDVSYALPVGDINNDGLLDIISGLNTNAIAWHQNLGNIGNQISGNILLDLNADGCDASDLPLDNIMVISESADNTFAAITDENGDYLIQTTAGDFNTSITHDLPNYFTSTPESYTSNFSTIGNSIQGDFCFETTTVSDLSVSLYPLSEARPGFDASYQIVYKNHGGTIIDGTIILTYDDSKMSFLTADETVSSSTANSVSFDYANLNPFETRTITLDFNIEVPPTTNIDDVLIFNTTINPVSGDFSPNDNVFELNQIVIGAFDPNDIQVLEGNAISLDQADDYLHYLIRFQNTGTASAINVEVTNNLNSNLDWSTFQIENMSHPGTIEMPVVNSISFEFNDINLPDSTSNEPGSHGYIQYKIKPIPTIAISDIIPNKAHIYFDFNPPIETNTVTTTIVDNLSVNDYVDNDFIVHPNPAKGILTIESATPISSVTVYDQLGKMITIVKNSKTIDLSSVSQGLYFVRIEDSNKNTSVKKVIKQ